MGCIYGKNKVIVKSNIKPDNTPAIIEDEKKQNIPKIIGDKTDSNIDKERKKSNSPKNATYLEVGDPNPGEVQKSKEAMNKLKEISLNEVVKSRKFF